MFQWLTGRKFDPDHDIPSLAGRVIVVTGGNGGLGKETIRQLAKHEPAQIFLAARSKSKADAAIADLMAENPKAEVEFIKLDLTSLASVKEAAEQIKKQTSRLDILINNAGVMALPYSRTQDGYEIQFGTNHMGHALLTRELLPLLLSTARQSSHQSSTSSSASSSASSSLTTTNDVRVINVSSIGHALAPSSGIIYDQASLYDHLSLRRYGNSKLANILHARELARRHPEITATAIHPGIIMTDLYGAVSDQIPFGWGKTLSELGSMIGVRMGLAYDVPNGAKNTLWAATADRETVRTSPFWRPIGIDQGVYMHSGKENLARELWEWTEEELIKHGY